MYFKQSILNTLTTKYLKYYFKYFLPEYCVKYFKYLSTSIFSITGSVFHVCGATTQKLCGPQP